MKYTCYSLLPRDNRFKDIFYLKKQQQQCFIFLNQDSCFWGLNKIVFYVYIILVKLRSGFFKSFIVENQLTE